MKICVFGAGAVGGHLAAKLAQGGHDVSVVARGAHLAAMREKGITLLHGDKTIRGKVRAAEWPADLGPQDFVFVTLKANSLGTFADSAAPLLGLQTGVVFTQNGIPWWYASDNPRLDPGGKLARAISPERVLGGVAYSANEVIEPGVVKNFVPGNNMFVIGRPDRKDTPALVELRKALEENDMSSPPVADIRQSIWAKLAQNIATSNLAVLTGGTLGEIRGDAGLEALAQKVTAEARAIAASLGVSIDQAPKRPSGAQNSGAVGHKTSMLQDYERGRPMEIDAQLTAPLAMARAAEVSTPTLDALVALCVHKAAARGLYQA
ncbi:MAG: ketopantoate reductase family protein [Betaproteobacteria bacterium]